MFTKHGCRGQGVGKALLKAAVKYGQDLAGRLERPYVGTLVSESDNDAARALYGKVGFVPIKTVQYVLHYERTLVVFQYKPEVEVKEAR
jgi:ribosomal protein S18 acetylase RimI-like enzyme